jgi:tetratricopeptide (TPR) repeat protein
MNSTSENEAVASREDEISSLEDAFAGRRPPPPLRLAAAAGRLAELYLQARDRPDRFPAAYRVAQTALSKVAPDDPLYPKLLHYLAMALRLGGDPSLDIDTAWARADCLDRDSWLLSLDAAPQEARLAARQWGQEAWCSERWKECAEAFEGAEIALSRCILRETEGLHARLDQLTAYRDQAPRAAFAYAKDQRPQQAITVLERAAARLLSFGEHERVLRELAAAGYTDLCDRLAAARRTLAQTSFAADSLGRRSPARLQAQAAVDGIIAQIRAVPGFSGFARPTQWDEITLAAQDSTLAYVAPTDKGTVVLLLRPGERSISSQFADATLEEMNTAARPWIEREFEHLPGDVEQALADFLQWLNANIASHVYHALGGDHPVVLIPFGILALHPLHAALANAAGSPTTQSAPHWQVHPSNISYAYSARTLNSARRRKASIGGNSALVVNNPEPLPVEFDPLPLVSRDCV